MSQQINLFNPIFLKQKKHFSAVTMAQALGMILLGSCLLAGYTNYRVSGLAREAEATSTQLASVKSTLSKIDAQFGPRQKSGTLEAQVKVAESEVAVLQKVADILRKGEFGNENGYSEYMRAFARQSLSGVWLTGFTISGAGSEITLQGRALQAELVPAYITRLKREPSLQGKTFAVLEMQSPIIEVPAGGAHGGSANAASATAGQMKTPGYIDFSLRSSELDKASADQAGAKRK
ncbi:MAG TPA: PilN domain-containing protein [Noviherbaspirillum sp.]|jgi:hypothetical protein|uniref:PilN domain-containing protein n=1 Tax=Noviherbaspirillum sp. TaxID=1926288 RepID=UPI002DDCB566|nr:PilN domain-containing protein [Noviherbaspirillum sp.]HEV2610410.1 PilN domain-containing protein [Noviherbaspirillum sp.]